MGRGLKRDGQNMNEKRSEWERGNDRKGTGRKERRCAVIRKEKERLKEREREREMYIKGKRSA